MKRKQAGFTLIESLLVLSIFMIIASITAFNLKPDHMMAEDELFISQLKADLLYAQQYAMSHQCEVTVMFWENDFEYSMYVRFDVPLVERKYSTNIIAYGGSLPLNFKFLPDGNVSKFGTFFIKSGERIYKFTVLIGKGRFYVTAGP